MEHIYYADTDKDYDSEDFTCAAFTFEGNSFEYTFGRNIAEPTRHDQFVEVDRTWFDLKLPHLSKVLPITMK